MQHLRLELQGLVIVMFMFMFLCMLISLCDSHCVGYFANNECEDNESSIVIDVFHLAIFILIIHRTNNVCFKSYYFAAFLT